MHVTARFTRLLPALAILAIVLGPTVATQPAVLPLSLDDAFSSNTFHINGGAPTFSPDTSRLAFVRCDHKRRAAVPLDQITRQISTRGGAAMYSLGCDVWVSPVTGGDARNVSGAQGNNWAPAWSPDGQRLAFYSDRHENGPHLWVWELATGTVRQVSDARVRTTVGTQRPMWLPDGKRVIARLRPEGMTDADLGDDDPPGARAPAATKGNASTVVVYESGQPPKPGASDKSRDAGPPPKRQMADLAVVSIANGDVRRIVKGVYTIGAWLSPDGTSLLHPVWKGNMVAGSTVSPFGFAVVDVETGQSRVVVDQVLQGGGDAVTWSPDGKWIAYLDATDVTPKKESLETGYGVNAWGQLRVAPVAGGAPKKLAANGPPLDSRNGGLYEAGGVFDMLAPLWSAAGDAIYVIGDNRVWRGTPADGRVAPLTAPTHLTLAGLVPMGRRDVAWAPSGSVAVVVARDKETVTAGMHRVGADGRLTVGLDELKKYGSREASPLASADGRRVVYTAETATVPPELWTTTADFSTPVRVTRSNPQFDKYVFGEPRLIEYRSTDGKPLRAALLLPAGYEQGKRYPLITLVYASGMLSRDLTSFGFTSAGQYNYHLQTTRGYAVLAPDIPVNVGSPMQDLLKGVMPAIDKVIELGIADPDRLGVTGQSNGGYSTLSLIVQTNRFKAAVMNAGFGDLTGFYGAMRPDGGGSWHPWLEQLGGAMGVPPWENPQRYIQNSPIYYLDRITTPLVIQAGGDDASIVPFSDQVFVALKRLNKKVVYLRYGSEGHLLELSPNKIDYWTRVFKFWDEHLKAPGAPAAPTGPSGR